MARHRPSDYLPEVVLARPDFMLGGVDTFPLYEAEVERVAKLVRTGTDSAAIKRNLQVLFAEHAQQAGWAAFDAGLQTKARQLFETSFEVAKEAHSADLAGNARVSVLSAALLGHRRD